MRKRMGVLLACIACLALGAPPARAQNPWLPPPDHGLVDVSYTIYEAKSFFDGNGHAHRFTDGDFSDHALNVYGEHAFDRRNALVYNVDFLRFKKFGTPLLTASGPGDWRLGWKHSLGTRGRFAQALELDVSVPTGYDGHAALPRGLDSVDVTLEYALGSTFPVGRAAGYWDAYLGYKARLGPPDDQIVYGLGAGVPTFERLLVFAQINGYQSLGGRRGTTVFGSPLLAGSFNLVDLNVGLNYAVGPDFNVHVSHVWDLFGRDTGQGSAWQVGVSAKY